MFATSVRYWLFAALVCILPAAGCKSSPTTTRQSPTTPANRLEETYGDLVSSIESIRDRAFDTAPTLRFEAESSPSAPARNKQARRECRFLARWLFDVSLDRWPPPANALSRLASYDPNRHAVVVHRPDAELDRLRAAVASALVDGLDHHHFDPLPAGETCDASIARNAARAADQLLAVSVFLARRRRSDLPVSTIADRPELAGQLSVLARSLRAPSRGAPAPVTDGPALRHRTTALAMRKGLTLAAALHRSNGWSGVELLASHPPDGTDRVVRPDEWMAGPEHGEWQWPSPHGDASVRRSGHVGAALTALWLRGSHPGSVVRTVYDAHSADAYRVLPARVDGKEGRCLQWLTHWTTPHRSRQMLRAVRKRLSSSPMESRKLATAVQREGLTVATVISTGDRCAGRRVEKTASALAATELRLRTGRGLPSTFVPARAARFRRAAHQSELDDRTWTDPASGLEVELDALEDWKIRRSQTLPLRWFARHPEGVLLELSTELQNPLDPRFETDAYVDVLRNSFRSSFESVQFDRVERSEAPLPGTLSMTMSATRGASDRSLRMHVWQFHRGDVVVTLSLQTSPGDVGLPAARSTLSSVEKIEQTDLRERESNPEGEGIIQFKVEEGQN
ncbi:MAG: hypothetical protein ABEL76_17545 [Bradymonadaceae bacterium]